MGEFKVTGLGDITQGTAGMSQIHRAPALRGPIDGILGICLCVREYDTQQILPNCFPKGSIVFPQKLACVGYVNIQCGEDFTLEWEGMWKPRILVGWYPENSS